MFLVQKEVADRVTAAAGTPEYGALSIGVQAVARAERLFTVSGGSIQAPAESRFRGAAADAAGPARSIADEERDSFRALVVGLFGFRRKQMLRGAAGVAPAGTPTRVSARCSPPPAYPETVRPEVLSPAEFVRLHRALVDGGWTHAVAL